jgi:hypothetical protein
MEPQLLESFDAILAKLSEDDEFLAGGYPATRCSDAVVVRDAINETAMTADFVIVTRQKGINRNGHRVLIAPDEELGGKGLVLDNFATNPVVLWNHGFGGVPFPIARSTMPVLSAKRATATAQFSKTLPEAAQIFALIAEGILNTSSISFLPSLARLFKPESKELDGDMTDFARGYAFDFLTNDLLEWSVVDIPADPGAVRKCLERGSIAGERITQSLRPSLVKMAGDKPVLGVGADFEALRQKFTALETQHSNLAGEHDTLVQAVGFMGDMLNAQHVARQAAADKAKEQERLNAIAGQVQQTLRSALNGVHEQVTAMRTEIEMLTGKY